MEKIFVWYVPSSNHYYYKVGKGNYKNYHVKDQNSYGHILVLIIDLNYFMTTRQDKTFVSYKKMIINDIIRLLEKLK